MMHVHTTHKTERMEHTRHRPVVATAKHFEVTMGVLMLKKGLP